MIDFFNNNRDEILVGVLVGIILAILVVLWKHIKRVSRFIFKKLIDIIKRFIEWLIRIKNRQLTSEEIDNIRRWLKGIGIVDESYERMRAYLKRDNIHAGTLYKNSKNRKKSKKVFTPSKRQLKIYAEIEKDRKENMNRVIKQFDEKYPPLPKMAEGTFIPIGISKTIAENEQKQTDRKTNEEILKELKKMNKKR